MRVVGTDMMSENTRADFLGLPVESREGEVVFHLPQTLLCYSVAGCRAWLCGVSGEWRPPPLEAKLSRLKFCNRSSRTFVAARSAMKSKLPSAACIGVCRGDRAANFTNELPVTGNNLPQPAHGNLF